jgi:hypothetical protein
MASDTVPAAVPTPGDPSGTLPDTPPQSGLTGLLAPITPARNDPAAFDLNPTLDGDNLAALSDLLAGGSSSDFHQNPDTPTANTSGGDKTSSNQQGIWRAWMLALAKRHEQAGAARLKALDVKKARATALQVKEQRTTNRSEKIVGGNTGTNTNTQSKADKSNGSKTSTSAGRNDHKNHHTKTSAPSGSSGRGGHAGGGSGSGGRGSSGAGPGSGRKDNGKGDAGKGTGSRTNNGGAGPKPGPGGGSGSKSAGSGGKDGSSGRSGGTGKPGKDGNHTTGNRTNSGTGGGPKTSTATCGTGSGIDMTKKPKDKPAKDTAGSTDSPKAKDSSPVKPQPPATGGKGESGKTGPNTGPGPGAAGGGKTVDLTKAPDTKNTKPVDKTNPPTPPKPKTPPGPPKSPAPSGGAKPTVNTQGSREAGYRDGTRLGKVEAHIGAYRDGVRDGRDDIKQAADREKARLDRAHQAGVHQRRPPTASPTKTIPPKPTQPPAVPPRPEDPPMTTDTARPVQVNNVNASHIELGEGAARQFISRGEVRTLRGFQKRLDGKTDRMTRVAEATRTLEQHAQEQVREVAFYRELAMGVKGGEKLLGALARLEEAATVQASKAAFIHKRAVRGAEACRVLNANAETRYGGIYKAVVDSPETTPAEMRYYREMSHA